MLSYKYYILLIFAASFICTASFAEHKESNSSDYKNAKKVYDNLYVIDEDHTYKAIKGADSLINAGEINGNYLVSCLGYALKAKTYYRETKIEEALSEIDKWKSLAKKNKDYEEYFFAFYTYCDYQQDINSAKALFQGQKMITEAQHLKYMPGLAMAHEMQGNLALYILQDFQSSTYHYKSAIDIVKKLHNNTGPELGRLYFRLASSLVEEHKYSESEVNLQNVRKFYGKNLPAEKELRIFVIQLDNAYNSKADANAFDQAYQKVIHHKLYESVYGYDTRLFYKIRWLIRTNRAKEALAEIPHLCLAIDRAMLKSDAYVALGDWRNATIMKDSVEMAKDSLMHELRNEELVELDAKMRNTELTIESTESKSHFQYVLFSSIAILLIIAFAILTYLLYRRRKHKLEEDRVLFVRNVTHQLRTPMTVVTGMVDQLKEHIPADDVVGIQNLEATKRQSRKLQELIMQLARMSKTGVIPLINEQGDISIPTVFTTTAAESIDTSSLPSYNNDKPSILLAEDTDDVAMMMCGLLRENGYNVTRAIDGKEALEMLQHELPDLLITDVAMPRMDGLELMRLIRNDDTMCHLPIIVASARVEDSERMEGISAGAEVYLTKPFIPEELLLRISTMLRQREVLRRYFSNTEAEREKSAVPQMTEEEQTFINAVNKCIEDNITTGNISTNYIADYMCTSVSTINRRIKNITGMPIATYVRTRRIIKAKQLLSTTEKSITEIEIECGFTTPGHLSRLFKTETGMSPSEYRHQKVYC